MPLSPLNKSSLSAGAMSPNGNDHYMTLNRSANAEHTDDQYMTLQRALTGSTLLGSFNAVAANFNHNSFQQPPSKRVSIVSGDGEIYDGTYLNADGVLMRKHYYLKSLKTLKVPGYNPAPSSHGYAGFKRVTAHQSRCVCRHWGRRRWTTLASSLNSCNTAKRMQASLYFML